MRNIRLFLVLLAALAACLGSAQITTASSGHWTNFAVGEGVLHGRHDIDARFAFHVTQTGDQRAEGRFRFGVHIPDRGKVHIVSFHINHLRVGRHEAWFSGPAVFEVMTRDGTHRFEGGLRVHVRDNVEVGDGHHRRVVDMMELHFQARDARMSFDFAGWATHDSIQVGRRR